MGKILVIDDDPGFLHMVNLILTRLGHEVVEARDGEEGVQLFKAELPDLVICDIVMPNKEGVQTMLEIRALTRETPIIAMSGGSIHIGKQYLDMAHRLGAHAVLSKPFRPAELVALVTQWLGSRAP